MDGLLSPVKKHGIWNRIPVSLGGWKKAAPHTDRHQVGREITPGGAYP